MNSFFSATGWPEKIFRVGVLLWAALILLLGTLVTLSILVHNKSFTDPLIVIGPSIIALTITLFVFALVRIVITFIRKQYGLAVGYLAYAGLVGLLIIPMVAALYDRYRLLGSFF